VLDRCGAELSEDLLIVCAKSLVLLAGS